MEAVGCITDKTVLVEEGPRGLVRLLVAVLCVFVIDNYQRQQLHLINNIPWMPRISTSPSSHWPQWRPSSKLLNSLETNSEVNFGYNGTKRDDDALLCIRIHSKKIT